MHLRRSGSLGGIPSAPFQLPVAGATTPAAAAVPASYMGVTPGIALIGATAPETQRRSMGMGSGMINMPGASRYISEVWRKRS